MHKLIWAALAATLLLFAATPRNNVAQDFGIEPERKLAKDLEDLADVMFECGDEAKGKGLYTYARSYFNYGLQYDPDHRKIRKTMGYKKKRGGWVLEEDMVPLKDKINESNRQELLEKLQADTLEIRQDACEELWKDYVQDADLPRKQRLLALYHIVRIFPEHRGAQKTARVTPDGAWYVHTLDDDSNANRVKWIERASKGELIEDQTGYEQALGYDMPARRSNWMVFHVNLADSDKSLEWAENLTQYAEACRIHGLDMAGLEAPVNAPADDANRLHYSVFSEREKFSEFVDKCSGIPNPSERRARAKSGGTQVYKPYGAVWMYPNTNNDYGLRDGITHDLAYKEILRHTRTEDLYWLPRGFAYLASTKMNGSVQSRFYATRATGEIDTGGAEALPGFGASPAGWRLRVGLLTAGDTLPTPTKLTNLGGQHYSEEEIAAAYCYVDFLVNEHKEKLGEFLRSAYDEALKRHNEEQKPENGRELLKRLFDTLGMDEEAFVSAFKTWAAESYFELPSDE